MDKKGRKYSKEYYSKHKDKMLASIKKWQDNNKDKIKKYRNEYYKRPSVKLRKGEYNKRWYEKNRERRNEYCRNYRKNSNKYKDYIKKYYLNKGNELDNSKELRSKRRESNRNYYNKTKEIRKKCRSDYYNKNKKIEGVRNFAHKKIPIPKNKKCEECGKRKATMRHHKDYSKPLEVIFVCSFCHGKTKRKFK